MDTPIRHGRPDLPLIRVDAYNAELRDNGGFLGDRASSRAFRDILDDVRELFPDHEDPLGPSPTEEISKKRIDDMLISGDPEAGGVVVGAIEAWAREFDHVIRRFLRMPEWKGTERIVVGGGLRGSRVGELAIGRTTSLLRGEGVHVDLVPIRHDPDEAGLVGALQLVADQIDAAHDAMVAVDIGGTNMRVGLVAANLDKADDFSAAAVVTSERWAHREEEPSREDAVKRLAGMIGGMIDRAKEHGLTLAPYVGIGCPGIVLEDGTIDRGGQNLPGNWEGDGFHLPEQLRAALPQLDGHAMEIVMHNDAVVQGLSELPYMRDVRHWGVMTIGTGLGNARYTNPGR